MEDSEGLLVRAYLISKRKGSGAPREDLGGFVLRTVIEIYRKSTSKSARAKGKDSRALSHMEGTLRELVYYGLLWRHVGTV